VNYFFFAAALGAVAFAGAAFAGAAFAFAGVEVICDFPGLAALGAATLLAATGAAFLAAGSFFVMTLPLENGTMRRQVPTAALLTNAINWKNIN
jgi:hypothetical protein